MSIRRWKINKPDLNLVSSIIEHTSLSELAAKLLASRGITPNEAKGFIQADSGYGQSGNENKYCS